MLSNDLVRNIEQLLPQLFAVEGPMKSAAALLAESAMALLDLDEDHDATERDHFADKK